MLSRNSEAASANFSSGKFMKRSLSVSLPKLGRNSRDEKLVSKTTRNEIAIPEPLEQFFTLVQVDSYCHVPGVIGMVSTDQTPQLAEALVGAYQNEGGLHMMRLLKHCLQTHLRHCNNEPEQVFRGTSLETKIISIYLHTQCRVFVARVINPLLDWIESLPRTLEVDPSKSGEEFELNAEMLLRAAEMILEAIRKHMKLIPLQVCEFFGLVRKTVGKKFPDMAEKSVASLLFLRLLNPVLVSPDSYMERTVSPSSRRTSILISKVIQNLANGVEFGSKEDYLVFANEWLTKSAPKMRDFIFDAIFGIYTGKTPVLNDPSLDLVKSLSWLHNFFCWKKRAILQENLLDGYFRDAKQKQTFLAQIRKCTNNFRPVSQEDMPMEWIKEMGLDRNFLQKSYSKVRDGISEFSKRSQKENASDPMISYPTLNADFPVRSVEAREAQQPPAPQKPMPAYRTLRRGKSANLNRRSRIIKKSVDETVVINPLTPNRVRPRDENDELGSRPMEMSTPMEQSLSSPAKKVKSRESIGELAEFTPLKKIPNPTRGHE